MVGDEENNMFLCYPPATDLKRGISTGMMYSMLGEDKLVPI
jgi:hypothetical protein